MSNLRVCSYSDKCYRQNPLHFREFSHPHLEIILKNGINPVTKEYDIPEELQNKKELILTQLKVIEDVFAAKEQTTTTSNKNDKDVLPSTSLASRQSGSSISPLNKNVNRSDLKENEHIEVPRKTDFLKVIAPKGQMNAKLLAAAPYNFFLTAIVDSKETHKENLTVTFQEIFDESLGEIDSTLQINFIIDVDWLLTHYYFAGILSRPLLILYGAQEPELENITKLKPNVTSVFVKMPDFAISHAKVMLISYKDGSMRVVISTANLYADDWENRTQGLWISPTLPKLPTDADTTAGESPTNFRNDLMLYLVEYRIAKLQPWIARIRSCDFSAINVFFIGSVPGTHRENRLGFPWGHARVGSILRKHCTAIEDRIPIICQSSSIGSLGANVQAWIHRDVIRSFRNDCASNSVRQLPPFKMIYPSLNNVLGSYDGILGGGCLPYSRANDTKQPWLKSYLHQWCAKDRYRSRAMPHIKCYTRLNLSDQCIYWFLLTSANLSKAALGCFGVSSIQPSVRIRNYEAGVLFMPRFVTGDETFPLANRRFDVPPFPLPYDIPLTPYMPDDEPFVIDYLN